jgi:hypothetical protein
MLYKRQVKKPIWFLRIEIYLFSTCNTQWGLNTVGFPWFYDYDKMGGMLCLYFSDRWVVCREDGFLGFDSL